ncbi:ML domain-containing protein [Gamsiella multidivaricata]|uniref:ML domain-containing protein n=1 Tax=Gamsiella multidivaricata TaxID=101098 RepID=UPI00221F8F11|nr:ML domain-containing protein [Gamsiella multidivaricata]KAI7825244.1 ML domain-containing protein [Gamsiella multidivaricata]
MKSFLPIVLATAVTLLDAVSAAGFYSCASNSTAFQLTNATYSPDPLIPGQEACMTIEGNLTQPINNGSTVVITASIFGITLYNTTTDLCNSLQSISNSTTQCPIQPTNGTIKECVKVPSGIPSGISVDIRAEAKDAQGNELFCLVGPLTFGSSS